MKMIFRKYYGGIEKWLLPTDNAVRIVLVAIIVISVIMLFQPSRSLRTLWTVYMVAP